MNHLQLYLTEINHLSQNSFLKTHLGPIALFLLVEIIADIILDSIAISVRHQASRLPGKPGVVVAGAGYLGY